MNYNHYLPETKWRILRLQRIIGGRPVAILLPGFSLYGLQKRIDEFKDLDICYASLNNYSILEDSILSKIGKHFSILMCSANPDQLIEPIVSFLKRDENNVFISEKLNFKTSGGENLLRLYNNHSQRLLFFTSVNEWDDKPNSEYPLHFLAQNSLSILLSFMIIGKARNIILFGADGGRVDASQLYFGKPNGDYAPHPDGLMPGDSLLRDTKWFNQYTPLIIKRLAELYKSEPAIMNCSLHSHLNTFPKISYDEAITSLKMSKCLI